MNCMLLSVILYNTVFSQYNHVLSGCHSLTCLWVVFLAAGPNQDAGMKIVYRTLPVPYLKVKDVSYILQRASLAPCFLAGQETPTVPASLARHFPLGKADTRDKPGSGSEVFEVNMWAMIFGRPKERTLSVKEAEERRAAARKARTEKARARTTHGQA